MINRRQFLTRTSSTALGISGAVPWIMKDYLIVTENNQPQNDSTNELIAKLSSIPAKHPSLHFDSKGLARLRLRANDTHKKYRDLLLQWIERNRTWSPLDFPYPEGREVALEQCGAFITNAALAYLVSEKPEHLDITQRWILEMLKYPIGDGNNYGFGIYAAGLARVYDWLFDVLPKDMRQTIKDTLSNLINILYKGSFPGTPEAHWWAPVSLHHDHWIPVGGFGEASLALIGETKDAAVWAARAKTDFDSIFSLLGEDGAWHEGSADWCYAMAPLLWFYGAWESVTGENLHNIPWIQNTAAYRLYHWLPDDSYVNLNDSFRSGRYNTSGSASCHLLRRLASLFSDGNAQWLADRDETFDLKTGPKGVYQAPYENLSFNEEPKEYPYPDSQCAGWNLLWYDPSVKATPPDNLPHQRHFSNQGVVIMRTGWDTGAAVVSHACAQIGGQRCGEKVRAGERIGAGSFSHAHTDYNSFTLYAKGSYFITPPGYARRSSVFQNVVQVNGADYVMDLSAPVKILASVAGQGFYYSVGDSTAGFRSELGVERYRRHLVLLDGGWLFVFDVLRLTEKGRTPRPYNRYDWMVHSNPSVHTLSVEKDKAVWRSHTDNNSQLTMYVLYPSEFAWERASLQSLSGKNMLEALHLSRPEWYSGEMIILTAFSWLDKPIQPSLIQNKYLLAVTCKGISEMPAIGFSLTGSIPSDFSYPDLQGQELLIFGSDLKKPESILRVKEGKVQ